MKIAWNKGVTTPLASRFWANVADPDRVGCRAWLGVPDKDGYGHIKIDGRKRPATHAALLLDGRPVPPGAWALHHCDNPSCVEASHLYIGDHAANVSDKMTRGRQARGAQHSAACVGTHDPARHNSKTCPETVPRGVRHGNAKLTDAKVREARRLRALGVSYKRLAAIFGITDVAARNAVVRATWAHVR